MKTKKHERIINEAWACVKFDLWSIFHFGCSIAAYKKAPINFLYE